MELASGELQLPIWSGLNKAPIETNGLLEVGEKGFKRMSEERDLRKYARSTQRRLILGLIGIAFLIGDGLIWIIYGQNAGRLALICTAIALVPALLIALLLFISEWLVRKYRDG